MPTDIGRSQLLGSDKDWTVIKKKTEWYCEGTLLERELTFLQAKYLKLPQLITIY